MTDTTIKTYLVGGAVRDKQLGLVPHDMDYAVEAPSFAAMKFWLEDRGYTIFQEREQFGVIRARLNKETSDYVLCRKEGPYTDHRHPDWVIIGDIYTDLARRDFTINAMAEDTKTGELIDPYDGATDLKDQMLRAVGNARDRLIEDPLRAFRAIRFAVTKNMMLDAELSKVIDSHEIINLMDSVSAERVREELTKAFVHNTFATLHMLQLYPTLLVVAEEKGLWLKPTTEKR